MAELNGKVAVITGAGSGLGRAAAQIFVAQGAKVIAADISGAQNATAASLGDNARACHCDVSLEDDVQAMIEAALATFGRIDAVLNVAGFGVPGKLCDVDLNDYKAVLDVDLLGVILVTKYAIRAMLPFGGGVILNWSSIAGLAASPNWGVYSAAKAGVIAITKATALEYGRQGIRANVICPGTIMTEGLAAMTSEQIAQVAAAVPMGRLGEAGEIGELAAFLASDRSRYVNGAVITVDGGLTCRLPG